MTNTQTLSKPPVRVAFAVAVALCVASGIGVAPVSAGPVGFQASGGWYTQSDALFLGAGARFGLGTITIIPNGEWLFVDSGSTYTLNLDGTMSVLPLGVGSGYVGAGIGWLTVDPKVGSSNTDTVTNLIAGFGFSALPLKPFAQLKWLVAPGDDPLVFSIGARF